MTHKNLHNIEQIARDLLQESKERLADDEKLLRVHLLFAPSSHDAAACVTVRRTSTSDEILRLIVRHLEDHFEPLAFCLESDPYVTELFPTFCWEGAENNAEILHWVSDRFANVLSALGLLPQSSDEIDRKRVMDISDRREANRTTVALKVPVLPPEIEDVVEKAFRETAADAGAVNTYLARSNAYWSFFADFVDKEKAAAYRSKMKATLATNRGARPDERNES